MAKPKRRTTAEPVELVDIDALMSQLDATVKDIISLLKVKDHPHD